MRKIRQFEVSGGTSFAAGAPVRKWRHPWKTRATYNTQFKRWEAQLRCGFVNGLDPLCYGYLSDDKEQKETREVEMWDDPILPITAMRVPGDTGDPIPGYFLNRGVRSLLNPFEIGDFGVVVDMTPADESGKGAKRLLRAVDFFIAVSRATYQAQITPVDVTGVSGLVLDYGVTYDTSRLAQTGTRARLMQAPQFVPVKEPTLAERFLGTFQDEGEDRIWISTVYLLSPPNMEEGEPDASWTPYYQHNPKGGFDNLCYQARNLPPAKPLPPIRLVTGLAGGFGDAITGQLLSGINSAAQQVSNALNTTTNKGKFWSI